MAKSFNNEKNEEVKDLTLSQKINVLLRLYIVPLLAGLLFLFIVFAFTVAFSVKVAPEVSNIMYAKGLQDIIIEDKNLSLPFPNSRDNPSLNSNLTHVDYTLDEMHAMIKQNYVYDKNSYDCKYWAYVWSIWWAENQYRHNFKIDYITTDNHVMVMFSNDSKICIANGQILDCYTARGES